MYEENKSIKTIVNQFIDDIDRNLKEFNPDDLEPPEELFSSKSSENDNFVGK